MLTFLFWNMGGELPSRTAPRLIAERQGRLLGILANLTGGHGVDLLILAESPLSRTDILEAVNAGNANPYRDPDGKSLCERVTIFPRFSHRHLSLFAGMRSRVGLVGRRPVG